MQDATPSGESGFASPRHICKVGSVVLGVMRRLRALQFGVPCGAQSSSQETLVHHEPLVHQGSSGFVSCSFVLARLDMEDQFSYLGLSKDIVPCQQPWTATVKGVGAELDATTLPTR